MNILRNILGFISVSLGFTCSVLIFVALISSFESFFESLNFIGTIVIIAIEAALFLCFTVLFEHLFEKAIRGIKSARINYSNRLMRQKQSHELQINTQKYQNAKNSYRYFSDDKIEELVVHNRIRNRFVKLALEETALERGIIDHSPLHEEMYREIAENL